MFSADEEEETIDCTTLSFSSTAPDVRLWKLQWTVQGLGFVRAALQTTIIIILNITTAKEGDSTESRVNNFYSLN